MRRILTAWAVLILVAFCGLAQQRRLKPGINFFSKQQDVQLGREAAGEIEKRYQILENREVNEYVNRIGRRLASQPQADDYPYTFKVVNEPSINAFALPGGPTYLNTGLILAAENEAQLAGVLAHEISHVALRHGTNQATKANLIQLPAMLAGIAIGGESLLAQLGQLGIGLGANSVLLKFSRSAERDADLLGARIMSGAGYNPLEMARFFEKLEAEGGSRIPQFLSDHPNPGNRVKSVEQEIRYLPQRRYDADTGQLPRIKAVLSKIPPPPKATPGAEGRADASVPDIRPSGNFLEYRDSEFQISYPGDWRTFGDRDLAGVTIASPRALEQLPKGGVNIAYGAIVSYYYVEGRRVNLRKATKELIERLRGSNPSMQAAPGGTRQIKVDGKKALVTVLHSESPYQGQTEVDTLITVARSRKLFYVVFIAPERAVSTLQPVFDQMLASVRFAR